MKNMTMIVLSAIMGAIFTLLTVGLSIGITNQWEVVSISKTIIGILGVGSFGIFAFVMFSITKEEIQMLIKR